MEPNPTITRTSRGITLTPSNPEKPKSNRTQVKEMTTKSDTLKNKLTNEKRKTEKKKKKKEKKEVLCYIDY